MGKTMEILGKRKPFTPLSMPSRVEDLIRCLVLRRYLVMEGSLLALRVFWLAWTGEGEIG